MQECRHLTSLASWGALHRHFTQTGRGPLEGLQTDTCTEGLCGPQRKLPCGDSMHWQMAQGPGGATHTHLVNAELKSLRFTSVYKEDAIVASGDLPWPRINPISNAALHATLPFSPNWLRTSGGLKGDDNHRVLETPGYRFQCTMCLSCVASSSLLPPPPSRASLLTPSLPEMFK